jgi:hypothetical protein
MFCSVVKNGDTSGHGIRLVLIKRNAADLEQVFTQINDRIVLQSGALRKVQTCLLVSGSV